MLNNNIVNIDTKSTPRSKTPNHIYLLSTVVDYISYMLRFKIILTRDNMTPNTRVFPGIRKVPNTGHGGGRGYLIPKIKIHMKNNQTKFSIE